MKKILFSTLLIFISLLFFAGKVSAKDYSITSADFTVQINSDGSADVTEVRTYNFDGSYTWADEWIPLSIKQKTVSNKQLENYRIENFSMKDENAEFLPSAGGTTNTYQISATPDKFYVKWYYQATNTTRTFTLNYKIVNAVTNQTDISEFYWQLIGDQWTKRTG